MNFLYDAACNAMLNGSFNWTAPKRLVAFGAGYAPLLTHLHVSDIGLTPIAVSELMTGLQVDQGWAKADAVHFVAPLGVEPVQFIVVVEDALDIMAAPLVAYIGDANEMPFQPDGRDRFIMPDAQNNRGWIRP